MTHSRFRLPAARVLDALHNGHAVTAQGRTLRLTTDNKIIIEAEKQTHHDDGRVTRGTTHLSVDLSINDFISYCNSMSEEELVNLTALAANSPLKERRTHT